MPRSRHLLRATGAAALIFAGILLAGCPIAPAPERTLTVAVTPADSGSVTADPSGTQFADGTVVTLTALSALGYNFARWEGDLSGTDNPASLTMDADKSVTAVFEPSTVTQFTLTVAVSPLSTGSVTVNPPGTFFDSGTTVTLTPVPASEYVFDHWAGDLTGNVSPASVVMDADKSVTAVFASALGLAGGNMQGLALSLSGTVSTFAGSPGLAGSYDGTGVGAIIGSAAGGVVVGSLVYFADSGNNRIRRLDPATGAVTTFSGSGVAGYAEGAAAVAQFSGPIAIATDGTDLFVSDQGNQVIRKVSLLDGTTSLLAGQVGASGLTDATGSSAQFSYPEQLCYVSGSLYLADSANHAIRMIVVSSGVVTTVAGARGRPARA